MRTALVLAAALLTAPALAQGHEGHEGHGGGHEGHDMSQMDDTSRFGAPGDAKKASRRVTIRASEIAYDVAKLDVKTGETITLVLVNDGTQDHELGIGDAAFFEAHRKMMAEMPGMEHEMSNMITAKPGETASLTWTFSRPGALQFGCSIPGHYELGMVGAISVK